MKLLMFFTLMLPALAMAAHADTSSPLYYTRATIMIERKSPPPKIAPPLPWQKEKPAATTEASGIPFDVEVRDGMTMYNQKGWFNLSSPEENGGVLLVFSAQGLPPVIRLTQYAPLDVLMIDREGAIIQIVPNIKLSDLEEEITPPSPILAYLFLKGGSCEKLSIKPGDLVLYKTFKRPPVVLSTPTLPTPPTLPPASTTPQPATPATTSAPAAPTQ